MRLPLPATTRPDNWGIWLRRLFWLNLVVEIGIVLTGGLVRLTGSGLGCPNWPECVNGSITPILHQAQSWHAYIEFGNRILTSVVSIVTIALLVAVVLDQRRGSSRRNLWQPVALILFGIAVQAVIGGISVYLKLNPLILATHFLTSMVLVSGSAWLVWREYEGDEPVWLVIQPEMRWLSFAMATFTAVVLVLGTMVTGAGPHTGDVDDQPTRLHIAVRTIAWLHADSVMLFCGLTVAMLIACILATETALHRRTWTLVLVVTLLQGTLGYTQYFFGIPATLVEFHMLGATLLVVAVTWGVLSLREHA